MKTYNIYDALVKANDIQLSGHKPYIRCNSWDSNCWLELDGFYTTLKGRMVVCINNEYIYTNQIVFNASLKDIYDSFWTVEMDLIK